MKKEWVKQEQILFFSTFAMMSGLFCYLAFTAFSDWTSKEIRRRAGDRCQLCDIPLSKGQGVTAHYNHTRDEKYDEPENGMLLCVSCEARWHFIYQNSPSNIGMQLMNNVNTIRGRFNMLSDEQKAELIREFGPEFARLVRNL